MKELYEEISYHSMLKEKDRWRGVEETYFFIFVSYCIILDQVFPPPVPLPNRAFFSLTSSMLHYISMSKIQTMNII
jgi:hypothetical protein